MKERLMEVYRIDFWVKLLWIFVENFVEKNLTKESGSRTH